MSVVEAVQKDVESLGSKAADSSLAATALVLAAALDGDTSATSKSMCAKALVDVMRELRTLAPPQKENDDLDEIRARREQRRAGGSTAAHPASS